MVCVPVNAPSLEKIRIVPSSILRSKSITCTGAIYSPPGLTTSPNQLDLNSTTHLSKRHLVQMDLFAKDHPLEAAALRAALLTQIVKPKLRSFEFEELPPTVRHVIYQKLLLQPKYHDGKSEDSDTSEHRKTSGRTVDLAIEIGEEDNQMHPEIMRTNKKIHKEAAAVLYGENWFTWSLYGMGDEDPMWYWPRSKKFVCHRRYSRLIQKMRIDISTRGDDHDPTQADAIFWTASNLRKACKVLNLNNFKILEVDFYNALGFKHFGKGYNGQHCLEPLKRCRAEKVSINPVQNSPLSRGL